MALIVKSRWSRSDSMVGWARGVMSMILSGDATRRTANSFFPRSMTLPPVFAAICPATRTIFPVTTRSMSAGARPRQQIAYRSANQVDTVGIIG